MFYKFSNCSLDSTLTYENYNCTYVIGCTPFKVTLGSSLRVGNLESVPNRKKISPKNVNKFTIGHFGGIGNYRLACEDSF